MQKTYLEESAKYFSRFVHGGPIPALESDHATSKAPQAKETAGCTHGLHSRLRSASFQMASAYIIPVFRIVAVLYILLTDMRPFVLGMSCGLSGLVTIFEPSCHGFDCFSSSYIRVTRYPEISFFFKHLQVYLMPR